jgi:RNA polymerase sigma-70 factor (ECF subfamily)
MRRLDWRVNATVTQGRVMIGINQQKQWTSGEAEYLTALKRLEPEAWEQLYTQLHGELHGLLRKQLFYRHDEDIDDYIQEAFCRAYASIQSFDGRSDIKTWIMSIARHVVLDALRASERQRRALQAPASVKTLEVLCHGGQAPDPERTAVLHELQDQFVRLIEEIIPQRLSRVLLTAVQCELTEAEVAKTLDMNRGTASSYIAQAKLQLRQCQHRLSAFL